jgi:hypothetical protein
MVAPTAIFPRAANGGATGDDDPSSSESTPIVLDALSETPMAAILFSPRQGAAQHDFFRMPYRRAMGTRSLSGSGE